MIFVVVEIILLICDVLVVGFGVVGLVVVVIVVWYGCWVVLVEKDLVFGGVSVWFGGWVWLLCNLLVCCVGIEEDIE